jgi:hypothetical protein
VCSQDCRELVETLLLLNALECVQIVAKDASISTSALRFYTQAPAKHQLEPLLELANNGTLMIEKSRFAFSKFVLLFLSAALLWALSVIV